MAALRGTIRGDKTRSNSDARSTRLSNRTLAVHADTWQTFSEIELDRTGAGRVTVRQNGKEILRATWSAETAEARPSMVAVTLFGRTGETISATEQDER